MIKKRIKKSKSKLSGHAELRKRIEAIEKQIITLRHMRRSSRGPATSRNTNDTQKTLQIQKLLYDQLQAQKQQPQAQSNPQEQSKLQDSIFKQEKIIEQLKNQLEAIRQSRLESAGWHRQNFDEIKHAIAKIADTQEVPLPIQSTLSRDQYVAARLDHHQGQNARQERQMGRLENSIRGLNVSYEPSAINNYWAERKFNPFEETLQKNNYRSEHRTNEINDLVHQKLHEHDLAFGSLRHLVDRHLYLEREGMTDKVLHNLLGENDANIFWQHMHNANNAIKDELVENSRELKEMVKRKNFQFATEKKSLTSIDSAVQDDSLSSSDQRVLKDLFDQSNPGSLSNQIDSPPHIPDLEPWTIYNIKSEPNLKKQPEQPSKKQPEHPLTKQPVPPTIHSAQGDSSALGIGFTDRQIDQLGKHLVFDFGGVHTLDNVKDVEYQIINDKSDKFLENHSGHFVALVKDNDTQTIAYFDPFGLPPNAETLKQIHKIMDKGVEYKLKINRIHTQPYDSDLCGLHSLMFLTKYQQSEGDFKFATHFGEKDITSYVPFKTILKQ